jgi:5-methylcytosine-specific restriction endonuclease McrA
MTLRNEILKLKEQGLLKAEIARQLGCSKGTVAYHVSTVSRAKVIQRGTKWKRKNTLAVKLHNFKYQKASKRRTYGVLPADPDLTLKNLIVKIGSEPRCYLTGVTIDLNRAESYSLDHIMPICRGGNNTLENCGLAASRANQAKGEMTYQEFVAFCASVVKMADGVGAAPTGRINRPPL